MMGMYVYDGHIFRGSDGINVTYVMNVTYVFFVDSGDRIVAAATPGMAAADALYGQPGAAQGSVLAQGLDGILAARRRIAATGRKHRRNGSLVKLYRQYHQGHHYLLNPLHHPGNLWIGRCPRRGAR